MNITPQQAEYLVDQMIDACAVKTTMKALCVSQPNTYAAPIGTSGAVKAAWLRELADALDGTV